MMVCTSHRTELTWWNGAPGGTLSVWESLLTPSFTMSKCGEVASALGWHPIHQDPWSEISWPASSDTWSRGTAFWFWGKASVSHCSLSPWKYCTMCFWTRFNFAIYIARCISIAPALNNTLVFTSVSWSVCVSHWLLMWFQAFFFFHFGEIGWFSCFLEFLFWTGTGIGHTVLLSYLLKVLGETNWSE